MCRPPGMNDQCLCVSDVREMRAQLQVVDNCGDLFDIACNALVRSALHGYEMKHRRTYKGQNSALSPWQSLLRKLIIGVVL